MYDFTLMQRQCNENGEVIITVEACVVKSAGVSVRFWERIFKIRVPSQGQGQIRKWWKSFLCLLTCQSIVVWESGSFHGSFLIFHSFSQAKSHHTRLIIMLSLPNARSWLLVLLCTFVFCLSFKRVQTYNWLQFQFNLLQCQPNLNDLCDIKKQYWFLRSFLRGYLGHKESWQPSTHILKGCTHCWQRAQIDGHQIQLPTSLVYSYL